MRFTNLRQLNGRIERWGMVARRTGNGDEVRLAFRGGKKEEASAYYGSADDLADLFGTAEDMYCRRNGISMPKFLGWFNQAHDGRELYAHLTPKQRTEATLRYERNPLVSTRVLQVAEVEAGDVIEIGPLSMYGDHKARMVVESINCITRNQFIKGVEHSKSYSPGTPWIVRQGRLDDSDKLSLFSVEYMATERLARIQAGRS